MKNVKSHFSYNKRQRNGIFYLVICIVLLQSIYFFVDFPTSTNNQFSSNELALFRKEIDSLDQLQKAQLNPKQKSFNPNYITDFKGQQIGMTIEEIDRLFEYRKTGAFINSSKQFQDVTKISDSLLLVISPFFKFPDWVSKQKITDKFTSEKKIKLKADINEVSKEELMKINGIGEKLADRILAYKEKLKGFSENNQLYEVYYLDKNIADKLLNKFEVKSIPKIDKLNINTATFKEVLSIVYIDYELTKRIFQYRDKVGKIGSIDELKKIDNFPLEKFNRIALYLQAN